MWRSGDLVRLSGDLVRLSGDLVKLSDYLVKRSCYLVRLSGGLANRFGDLVRRSGYFVRLSGDLVKLSGNLVKRSCYLARLSGGLANRFGDLVRRSGYFVRLSGGLVRLSSDYEMISGRFIPNAAKRTADKRKSSQIFLGSIKSGMRFKVNARERSGLAPTPKALNHSAQGCEERATLGHIATRHLPRRGFIRGARLDKTPAG